MTTGVVDTTVNGQRVNARVEARTLLVHFLREQAGQRGTRVGCDTTSCGACTVLLDGRAVKSCSVFALQASGREVTTIEGLSDPDGPLHPVQEAFRREHGLQCGYCTSGLVMAVQELVASCAAPSEQTVREAISGNLCRCTGYGSVVRAVQLAARLLADEAQVPQ